MDASPSTIPLNLDFAQFGTIKSVSAATRLIIEDGRGGSITFDFSQTPMRVTVSPNLSIDDAGKLLLNRTAQLAGSPEPFPDESK